MHHRWVEEAGGALEDEEEGVVEVSPLVSYAGEGLAPLVEGKVFAEAYVHELQVRGVCYMCTWCAMCECV